MMVCVNLIAIWSGMVDWTTIGVVPRVFDLLLSLKEIHNIEHSNQY